jgi:hypothetical protein
MVGFAVDEISSQRSGSGAILNRRLVNLCNSDVF